MKRKLLLILLLLGLCGVTYGQIRMSNDRRVLVSKRVSFGVKAGINDAVMKYTDEKITIKHQYSIKPAIGAYMEIPVRRFFSISPEFMFIQRGTKTSYQYEDKFTVDYKLNVRYFDFRIPLQFYWLITNSFKPYAFVAPDFGYVLGGKITLNQPGLDISEASCDVGRANMNGYDISALAGIGFRFDINMDKTSLFIKIEGAYNYGFINTFSDIEQHDGAEPLNVHAYNVTGKRYNRGIEVMISLGMPLYSKKGTCSYFEKEPRRW